jgi:phosphate:Na+ symporter
MLETLGAIFGGLGLFFIGIKGISANLKAIIGPKTRAALARATGRPSTTAVSGAVFGALTQSSTAVAVLATSMLTAGMLSLPRALSLVVWSNTSTSLLVMLTTIDLWTLDLYLIRLVGFLSYFSLDGGGRLRPALATLLNVAFLSMGLVILKNGAGGLRETEWIQTVMAMAGTALLPAFLAGATFAFVAQSSTASTILALTLQQAGLLSFDQVVMALYGATLGAGLAVLLLLGNLSSTARQLAWGQLLARVGATVLFCLLFAVERGLDLPLVLWLLGRLAPDLPHQLGLLFLVFQVVTALLLEPVKGPVLRLIAWLSPPSAAEALSRPQFIYAQSLEDAPTALDLVRREEERLLARLPLLLDEVREDAQQPDVPRLALAAASESVERAITDFLASLLERGCEREELDRAVALENRVVLLGSLRETVLELAATAEAVGAGQGGGSGPLAQLLGGLGEALHLLLSQLMEAATSGEADDVEMLRRLTTDRSEMMSGLRRKLVRSEPELGAAGQEILFNATSQFERAVWLIRRFALLLGAGHEAELAAE